MDVRKRAAAEAGFMVFLSQDPAPSKEQINEELQARGLPEIRDRTFKHYRRLAQRGHRSYVPINEFDISIKHQTVPTAARG
jgi:hypothetical protein